MKRGSHETSTHISPSKQRRVLARAGPCLDHSLLLQATRCAVVVVDAFCRGVPSAEIERVRLKAERRVFISHYLVPGPRAARDGPRQSYWFFFSRLTKIVRKEAMNGEWSGLLRNASSPRVGAEKFRRAKVCFIFRMLLRFRVDAFDSRLL